MAGVEADQNELFCSKFENFLQSLTFEIQKFRIRYFTVWTDTVQFGQALGSMLSVEQKFHKHHNFDDAKIMKIAHII